MHREHVYGKWEREPIFASSEATLPDGTVFSYFSHIVYDGEVVATAYAERLGDGVWEARVEENGEVYHTMREPYTTYMEAILDVISWRSGQ